MSLPTLDGEYDKNWIGSCTLFSGPSDESWEQRQRDRHAVTGRVVTLTKLNVLVLDPERGAQTPAAWVLRGQWLCRPTIADDNPPTFLALLCP
ncbi:unnamed protein product [Clonostachys rhizophaga]|uniref:Uncharacterized protein n=2 Tax=Clonostachys TaxID=110564 RepID=A0A9N9V4Y3_9HYPO|nr:unnamed protein product [Clonostachys rhizophaga]CAI6090470.1 unnamed protein product [Clonostachys chloroleuca]